MIPFRLFQKNFGRKYVCFNLSDKSQKELQAWCMKNQFDISKSFSGKTISPGDFDFHITIFYTNNEVYAIPDKYQITPTQIHLGDFDRFGKEKDTPVFKVKTENLQQFRDIYVGQNFKDEWPTWKPHISLSYNWTPTDKKSVYDGPPLFVDSISVKPLKD